MNLDELHQVMKGDMTTDRACDGMTAGFEIGHVSHRADGDYRKVAQGKWVPVKAAGGQGQMGAGEKASEKPAEQKAGGEKANPYKADQDNFMRLLQEVEGKEYTDPARVKVYRTDKGNWNVYYDGHTLGIYNKSKLDSEAAEELGWFERPTPEERAEADRQYNEVVAKYKGTDQWLKAPNGQPTKLTERQWVQVRTPNFKRWFGDWENDPQNASKVVDVNGEPSVLDGVFLNLRDKNPQFRKKIEYAKQLIAKEKEFENKYGLKGASLYYRLSSEELSSFVSERHDISFLIDALKKGRTPTIRVAFRYGDIRPEQVSWNYADNRMERGVSVVGSVKDMNLNINSYYDAFFGSQPYNVVIGLDLGNRGADGEMLLSPVTTIGKFDDLGKIVKSATDNVGTFSQSNKAVKDQAMTKELTGSTRIRLSQIIGIVHDDSPEKGNLNEC